jgi:pimeloyl-ACP methyl ester carboxylesterase
MFRAIPILLATIYLLASCKNTATENNNDDQMMGQFDSIIVAQEKGPSLKYYYENMVQHVTFPSKDSLTIFADIYESKDGPIQILLCHQAGYSRGAYINTGMLLSQLGYNAMAIDQRSGDIAKEIPNETYKLAKEKGLPTNYLDAQQDIEAAIDYVYDCNGNLPLILVGSSYSASLCLIIGQHNPKVKAIAAFSPGEYLEGIEVANVLDSISKPIFVTSSKLEISQTNQLIAKVDSSLVTHFKPEIEGVHGARALWKETEGHKEYWQAFLQFLKSVN